MPFYNLKPAFMERVFAARVNPLTPRSALTALTIFPRSDFDGFYLEMSLSHDYLKN